MEAKKSNFKHEIFNARLKEHRGFYEIAKKWWEEREWFVPPPERLSTLGVMAYYEDKPICAGWIYQTDSSMAVIGFIIADDSRGRKKKEVLAYLITTLEEFAKNLGFETVFMPMEAESVSRMAQKELNYVGGKTNELIKMI